MNRDQYIKETISNQLFMDNSMGNTDIHISVMNGLVKLAGRVDCYWKKMLAENYANNSFGVMDVRNDLEVESTDDEDLSDEEIAKNIEETLRHDSDINPNDIIVNVNRGEVTLAGSVPDWLSKDTAEASAHFTQGVRSVNNMIVIL